jgi:hypothetical protein
MTNPRASRLGRVLLLLGGGGLLACGLLAMIRGGSPTPGATTTTVEQQPSAASSNTAGSTSSADAPAKAAVPKFVRSGPADEGVPAAPSFGELKQRPGEDDTRFSLRHRFVQTYEMYVRDAKLTPEQDAKMKGVLLDAQLNYALWKKSFSDRSALEDTLAGGPKRAGESYMDQTLAALNEFIPTRFAEFLSAEQRALLDRMPYKYLATGNGMMGRPYDVDEFATVGISRDGNKKEVQSAILERLQKDYPGKDAASAQRRTAIIRQLGIEE